MKTFEQFRREVAHHFGGKILEQTNEDGLYRLVVKVSRNKTYVADIAVGQIAVFTGRPSSEVISVKGKRSTVCGVGYQEFIYA